MALTIGEANAFSHLLNYILNADGPAGPITRDNALKAALLLRDKAYKTLSAGMPPERLRALWTAYADKTDAERNGEAACAICGCTENRACAGGCCWMPNALGVDVCSACVDQLAALVVPDGTITLEVPEELGLAWDDGGDLLALANDGIVLTLRGLDEWELDAAGAAELAAHLVGMVQALEASAGGAR